MDELTEFIFINFSVFILTSKFIFKNFSDKNANMNLGINLFQILFND